MHDLAYFRHNFDKIAERLATRGGGVNLDSFRELDRKRRAAITEAEQLKAQKNARSPEIGKLKQQGVDTTDLQKEIRALGDKIAELDKVAAAVDDEFQALLQGVPNV